MKLKDYFIYSFLFVGNIAVIVSIILDYGEQGDLISYWAGAVMFYILYGGFFIWHYRSKKAKMVNALAKTTDNGDRQVELPVKKQCLK